MNKANLPIRQARIDTSPDATKHQVGVWRGRVRDHLRQARAYLERIEFYAKIVGQTYDSGIDM